MSQAEHSAAPEGAGRVLLVEDEEHLAFALQFNLEAEGYAVDVAGSLQEAREHLEGEGYDLVLLDVMLPDGVGFDLCVELRAQGVLTPVLMLTAKGSAEDIVYGLNAGADGYMTKPFHLQELLSRLAALIRRQRWQVQPPSAEVSDAGDAVSFGANHVDFARRSASAQGKAVELTELELRLLRFLVEHQGRPVSREELLEGVWDVSPQTNTRTVDNFIVRLRRLFEVDPSNPQHIVTVRGVGYRFVV